MKLVIQTFNDKVNGLRYHTFDITKKKPAEAVANLETNKFEIRKIYFFKKGIDKLLKITKIVLPFDLTI
jgi:hypothetical protein